MVEFSEKELETLQAHCSQDKEFEKHYKKIVTDYTSLARCYAIAGGKLHIISFKLKTDDADLKLKLAELIKNDKDFSTITQLLHKYERAHFGKAHIRNQIEQLIDGNENAHELIQVYASLTQDTGMGGMF